MSDVVDGIRAAILRGESVPNQRLIEADLSEQFAASRASVRAALAELANEGLIERVQNRGARVRAVSLAEAVEISEVRMVIEACAPPRPPSAPPRPTPPSCGRSATRCARPSPLATCSATPG